LIPKAPFQLFATFADSITLDDNKYHFKTYTKSFTGEAAQTTLMSSTNCTRDEAFDCVSRFLEAQLIYDCEKHKETEVKTKKVYAITSKGELVSRDAQSGRLGPETPEKMYKKGGQRPASTNIVYLDRDGDGKLVLNPQVAELAFKHFLGEKPVKSDQPSPSNSNSPSSVSSAASEPTPLGSRSRHNSISNLPVNSLSELVPIRSITVRDKFVRLKLCTHAFTGTEAIDWIVRNTSVINREEATVLGAYFMTQGWLYNLSDSHGERFLKDSKTNIFQPSSPGAQLAGWNRETDTPTAGGGTTGMFKKAASVLDTDFVDQQQQQQDEGGLKVQTAQSNRNSTSMPTSPVGGFAPSLQSARISQENLNKFENILRKSRENIAANNTDIVVSDAEGGASLYEWEVCHNHLIEMDGSQAKSKAARYSVNANPGDISPIRLSAATAAGIPNSTSNSTKQSNNNNNNNNNNGTKRSSVTEPAAALRRRPSEKDVGAKRSSVGANLMAIATKRDPAVDAIKDSNPVRLVQILDNDELRGAFELCVKSMYCEENFHFWLDVHAFRTLYSGCQVVPGEELNKNSITKEKNPMLIPHAIALYLKYVIHNAPFELNIVSSMKKKVNAVVMPASQYFELIMQDSIALDEVIVPEKIVKGGAEGISKFPTELEGFDATLFDVVEKHIFGLMANDSVPKFIKTALYHDIMSRLISSGRLIKRSDDGSLDGRRRSEVVGRRASELGSGSNASSSSQDAGGRLTVGTGGVATGTGRTSVSVMESPAEKPEAEAENGGSDDENVSNSKSQAGGAEAANAVTEATKQRMLQPARDNQAF
jgi:hypothetical protein